MDDSIWDGLFTNWDHAFLPPSLHLQHHDHQSAASDHRGGGNSSGDGHDGKGGSASKNHSEAEKRRRDRINAQLATLRKLVSNSEKMDKATLLGKVVEHVKELKSETKELSKVFTLPTDLDEVNIELDLSRVESSNQVFIKVSVCCEDRPELFSEIKHAFKSLRLTVVRADMTCLGGRVKCEFVLCVRSDYMSQNEMTTLKQSLKLLFGRIVSSSSWTSSANYRIKSKRQRFFCSSNYNTNDGRYDRDN